MLDLFLLSQNILRGIQVFFLSRDVLGNSDVHFSFSSPSRYEFSIDECEMTLEGSYKNTLVLKLVTNNK